MVYKFNVRRLTTYCQLKTTRFLYSRQSWVISCRSKTMSANEKPQSKFVIEEDIASGKWIKLSQITYTDPSGKERLWEAVRRTTKLPGNSADAVVSIPFLKRTLRYDCIVLVKQYRPPLKAYSIEFPAGLLDPKESAETCALRELKEETGYTGIAKHTSPAVSLDPGVGEMSACLVSVEIDGDLPENNNPKALLEEGEFIEVLNIPVDDLLPQLNKYASEGIVIDSRVYTYAVSMEQTRTMLKMGTLR